MQLIPALVGIALLVLALVDLFWTTLWVDGSAGPVTGRITTYSWRAVLRVVGRQHHGALSAFGPSILVLTVVVWILLLAAGWTLVFAADPSSLRDTRDQGFATFPGQIWFVAYSMFTVGNGDFSPEDGFWQVVASIVGGTGLFTATLGITYLLSVLSAVVSKRAFAEQVSGLGRSSEEFVLSGWNGVDLHALDRHLTELSSQLSMLTQQYRSYPVLQYYHAEAPGKSPVKSVAILDDALTVLAFGVAEGARPDPASLTSARSSVASFISETRKAAAIAPAPHAPPLPSLDALRRRGVPTVDDGEFERRVAEADDRRKSLLGLVRGDGWEWTD